MKPWEETFMGHQFYMNPFTVYFMGHEKLITLLPLAMNIHAAGVCSSVLGAINNDPAQKHTQLYLTARGP